MSAAQQGPFLGRWGWYLISKEEFLQWKAAHKRAYRMIKTVGKYCNWEKKDPGNRRMPPPSIPDVPQATDKPYKEWKKEYHEFLTYYSSLRRPRAEAPLEQPKRLDSFPPYLFYPQEEEAKIS